MTSLRLIWTECWESELKGVRKKMDYYLNEYSLRGQFNDLDEFYTSLREYTLPVLKKVREGNGNIIWKRDTFWQSEICNGVSLGNIPQKKNERSGEYAAFKIQLTKLAREGPFWENTEDEKIRVKEYYFDLEYCEKFDTVNCFSKAVETEGKIISFLHQAYGEEKLSVRVQYLNREEEYKIDNIFTPHWWDKEAEIRTWRIGQKYMIEIRANEFDFHPPHFHASSHEFSAVFKLSDGKLYAGGKKRWHPQMISEIEEWYRVHKEELKEAWDNLHGNL